LAVSDQMDLPALERIWLAVAERPAGYRPPHERLTGDTAAPPSSAAEKQQREAREVARRAAHAARRPVLRRLAVGRETWTDRGEHRQIQIVPHLESRDLAEEHVLTRPVLARAPFLAALVLATGILVPRADRR